jgi:hypothetical protein
MIPSCNQTIRLCCLSFIFFFQHMRHSSPCSPVCVAATKFPISRSMHALGTLAHLQSAVRSGVSIFIHWHHSRDVAERDTILRYEAHKRHKSRRARRAMQWGRSALQERVRFNLLLSELLLPGVIRAVQRLTRPSPKNKGLESGESADLCVLETRTLSSTD